MRFFLPSAALLGGCLFFAIPLSATTIVPFPNLGVTTAQSECVVLARAINNAETPEGDLVFHDTHFEVLEQVKGVLDIGQIFQVRAMSHSSGDFDIDIAGDFDPTLDKKYLLFLNKKGDFWVPIMLSYYVFEQVFFADDEYLVPSGGRGIETVKAPGGANFEPLAVYHSEHLLQNLRQHSSIPAALWDGSIGRTGLPVHDLVALDRSVPTGCDFMLGSSTNLARWQNAAVPVYYDDTNVPADWASNFANVLSSMNGSYTGVDPSDAGTTSYTPNCIGGSAAGGNFISYCDANLGGTQCALVIFDDPCNQMAALSGCSGILAFGGSYSSSSITHTYDGLTWRNGLYGYVIVNDGVPACWPGGDFEQILTHELTHAYRMDHLDAGTYPNQNMNPSCCNAINSKDIECMNYAYSVPAPVELVSFEARLQPERQTLLQWVTQVEKDNSHFTVQRSADGTRFEKLVEVPSLQNANGGAYEWTDSAPLFGTNYYLLSQTDWDGKTKHLGIKVVTVVADHALISIVPNPVEADFLRFRVEMPAIFEGYAEVLNIAGNALLSSELSLEKGSAWLTQPLENLPPGIYCLRLHDAQQQWTQRFIKN